MVEAPGRELRVGRRSPRYGESALDVELAVAAMVEEAECNITSLLDLSDDQPRSDGVYRAGRYEHSVACRD